MVSKKSYQNSWALDGRVGTLESGLWMLVASQTRLWILGIGSWTLDVKTLRF